MTSEFNGSLHTITTIASEWMTVAEAAGYLKTKKRTLLKWVREGSIKAWPLHGTTRRTWRFRREDLDAALGFVGTASFSKDVKLQAPAVLSTKGRIE